MFIFFVVVERVFGVGWGLFNITSVGRGILNQFIVSRTIYIRIPPPRLKKSPLNGIPQSRRGSSTRYPSPTRPATTATPRRRLREGTGARYGGGDGGLLLGASV